MHLDARIDLVRRRMALGGIDLLIAASNGLHTLDQPDPAVHLSGYRPLAEGIFLLFRDGTTNLIVSPSSDWERAVAVRIPSACVATDDLGSALATELLNRVHEVEVTRIATAGLDSLSHHLAEQILAIATERGEVCAFDEELYCATGRKSDTEIERARRAVAIAERGFEQLLEIARPGLPECELAVALNCFTKSLGADDNFLMLNASPHNPAVMPSSVRKIQVGDLLLSEFSPSYEGQFAQICRTAAVGPASAALQQKYDLLVRAMWTGIEIVRPGIPVSEVCNAIDRVLQAEGYHEYCRPPHMRRRGHGLGCGSISPGDVATDNDTLLEEDMLFIIHPNQYLPETGYMMCGEPVRVTKTGVEILTERTAALGVIRI
jgi:Xaa-Pro dipeptidase